MKPWLARIGVAAAVLAIAAFAPAQQKTLLALRAKAGQSAQYRSEFSVEVSVAGQTIKADIKQTERIDYKEVAPNGDITTVRTTESSETVVNGEKMDEGDEEPKPATAVVRPNGTLVSYKSEEDPEELKVAMRIWNASNVVFSDSPVGEGDTWSHEFAPNAEFGTPAGKASFKLVGYEKMQGLDCAKIEMTFEESGVSPAISSKSTVWVELANGDSVASNFSFSNVPFGGGPMAVLASGSGKGERISGSPTGGGAPSQPSQAEPKKEKDIDETVKDYEKLPGVFTLYRKKEAGRDTIYMEIAESQLGRDLLLQATASTGTSSQVVAGDPINDLLLRFVQQDERLLLVRPNTSFRAKQGTPTDRSVDRSFADSYLEAYKIEARQASRKSLLINVSDLFRGDIAMISSLFQGGPGPIPGMPSGAGYSLDRDKTSVSKIKNFPTNLVVETTYNFSRSAGRMTLEDLLGGGVRANADPRSVVVRVNYNLFALPESGYRPRLFDPRVGYFTADYQDFSKDRDFNQLVRQILRWRLEKQDPKAAVSAPKEPITFWLDHAIPTEYRDAVRKGILAWNPAFEKAGFKDAIVVKQMPDDSEFDHADMRYNVIRWVTSPQNAYAVALFRPNPLTGEILNASITVDAGIVRFNQAEFDIAVDPQPAKREDLHRHDFGRCDFGRQARSQAAFGSLALSLALGNGFGAAAEKAYNDSFIAHVVAHEMGHILGLRHNFIASTDSTLEQLANRQRIEGRSISASVMDYIPFNVAALRKKDGVFWSAAPGTYDVWAIRYGYSVVPGTTPEGELPALKRIAAQCNTPGYAYQSDETADNWDPNVTRFDLGKRPVEYWTRLMTESRSLMKTLGARRPKGGESYADFTRDFNYLLGVGMAQSAQQLVRAVGGLHLNANHRGDPGERPPLAPVPAADQKEALRLLNQSVLGESAFDFIPREYFLKFASDPNRDMITAFLSGMDSFPIRDRMSAIQTGVLQLLFAPDRLARVANNEFKVPGQLSLASVFTTVGQSVWSELAAGRGVSALRRQLQRKHIDVLSDIVLRGQGYPEDAKMMAWSELNRLRNRLKAGMAKSKATDPYTKVHLGESLARVERVLNAQQTIGGAPPRAPSMLEQLLGGAAKP